MDENTNNPPNLEIQPFHRHIANLNENTNENNETAQNIFIPSLVEQTSVNNDDQKETSPHENNNDDQKNNTQIGGKKKIGRPKKIKSAAKVKLGKTNKWAIAVKRARKALGLTGFVPLSKGGMFYKTAKSFYYELTH